MSLCRKGMCSRCTRASLKDIHGDGKLRKWCGQYGSVCQSVARNCPGPSFKDRRGGCCID